MIVVVVRQKIQPRHLDEYLAVITDHARRSATEEPGCLRFDVVQRQGDPTEVFIYEQYRDQAAVDAHVETERFKRVVSSIGNWFAEPEQLSLCDPTQLTEQSRQASGS